MNFNISDLKTNETLDQVSKFFDINITNLVNESVVTKTQLFDLYEAYLTKEREQLVIYRYLSYIVGTLIVLSNITVVVSSGLILKKGQQQKSTYLLLGNVSLADTIVGISLLLGTIVDQDINTSPMCIFQMSMLVCPAMVSIFSVGMIAIDRYIYILHGLYYQRWFTTTKVRIGIACIWMIGLTLGFLPTSGWTNQEHRGTGENCSYTTVFPDSLILFNSFLSLVPIAIVVVLYLIILIQAMRNVDRIKKTTKSMNNKQMRIHRGNVKEQINHNNASKPALINRSASCDILSIDAPKSDTSMSKSKSVNDINHSDSNKTKTSNELDTSHHNTHHESEFSIYTIESSCSDTNVSDTKHNAKKFQKCRTRSTKSNSKEPNKWRAVTVVLLTSGSLVITWVPFFIVVTVYILCENKKGNAKCIDLIKLISPMSALAFLNSIFNPLIYAWWHKTFKKTAMAYLKKYFRKLTCRNSLPS